MRGRDYPGLVFIGDKPTFGGGVNARGRDARTFSVVYPMNNAVKTARRRRQSLPTLLFAVR